MDNIFQPQDIPNSVSQNTDVIMGNTNEIGNVEVDSLDNEVNSNPDHLQL